MSIKRVQAENKKANAVKQKCQICKKVNGRLGPVGKKMACLGCCMKAMFANS